jgi:hypothetical protein
MQIGEDAWTLTKISELLGGREANILYSDWFVDTKFGDLSLKDLNLYNPHTDKNGRYVLWCDKVPDDTKDNQDGWEGTLKAFKTQYPTHRPGFSLELATGLLMHNRITEMLGGEERLFEYEYGWCLDYLKKGYDGRVSSVALGAGNFFSHGLGVAGNDPDSADSWLGSSALWNFVNPERATASRGVQGNWDLDTGKLG